MGRLGLIMADGGGPCLEDLSSLKYTEAVDWEGDLYVGDLVLCVGTRIALRRRDLPNPTHTYHVGIYYNVDRVYHALKKADGTTMRINSKWGGRVNQGARAVEHDHIHIFGVE